MTVGRELRCPECSQPLDQHGIGCPMRAPRELAAAAAAELDRDATANRFIVAARMPADGGELRISILRELPRAGLDEHVPAGLGLGPVELTASDALLLAAWLVAVAEPFRGEGRPSFDELRKAIES